MFISRTQPKRLFDNGGVLSCGRREPKYVRGAYCLFWVRRRTKKTDTMTTATMRVGTRVETRPETEEDPPFRAEATLASVCSNRFSARFQRCGSCMMLHLRPKGLDRSMCPRDELSANRTEIAHGFSITNTAIDECWSTKSLHDGKAI